ncbi:MAG: transcriptional repressor [Thermodesulfobacteriota bacterium]
MSNEKLHEKENFRSLIMGDDIGRVEDRLNIIDVFLEIEDHVTLQDLVEALRERGYDYDTDFVRQCMNRWVEHGFAQKKQFEGQPPRFEHRHLGRHHDHIICTKCGRISEFSNPDMENLQARIARESGFHMLQHKMEIYGICSDCLSKQQPLLPLSQARPGEHVAIKDMAGGRSAQGRLASMGLRRGDELEVISNNGQGRLIVGHGTTRLALGRGVADKIIVCLASQ